MRGTESAKGLQRMLNFNEREIAFDNRLGVIANQFVEAWEDGVISTKELILRLQNEYAELAPQYVIRYENP